MTNKLKCPVCQSDLRLGRKVPYCSKKCEASVKGYGESKISKDIIKSELVGTTAWRPNPTEPVIKIVSGYPITIFSDIHCPLHCESWIYQGLLAAQKFNSKILIINGDFIDANQISRHIGGYYRRQSELNDDFSAGEALLAVLAKHFEQIFFLNGNHCGERLIKVFRGEVAMQRLWKMFGEHKNVKVAARSFIEVNQDIIVGHPRQYSKIRGNTAQNIAQVWQKHVVLGHSHHSAKTISRDGKWQAVDVGCMAKLDQFEYTTYEINDMPKPVNGFAMIFNKNIVTFDDFTPWEVFGLSHEIISDVPVVLTDGLK